MRAIISTDVVNGFCDVLHSFRVRTQCFHIRNSLFILVGFRFKLIFPPCRGIRNASVNCWSTHARFAATFRCRLNAIPPLWAVRRPIFGNVAVSLRLHCINEFSCSKLNVSIGTMSCIIREFSLLIRDSLGSPAGHYYFRVPLIASRTPVPDGRRGHPPSNICIASPSAHYSVKWLCATGGVVWPCRCKGAISSLNKIFAQHSWYFSCEKHAGDNCN